MRRLADIIQAEQGAHRYAMNSLRRAATVLSKIVDRYQNRIKALLNPETSEELGGPLAQPGPAGGGGGGASGQLYALGGLRSPNDNCDLNTNASSQLQAISTISNTHAAGLHA